MARILGLDGGGTKTIAAVVDDKGEVVAFVSGKGLDPTSDKGWERSLADMIAPFGSLDAATLGLPFHSEIPEISARQIAVASALIGPQARVINDVAVAFEGALAGQDGVLVLAGTGSMAWARGAKGTCRVGGWGNAFGDEGSAYWIGREALAQVSRHLDGRQPAAAFAQGILTSLGIAGDALMDWVYRQNSSRAAIASVARHVSALAAQGDADAQALMDVAAVHLSLLGSTAARICGAALPLRWSFAGGVFSDARLRRAVTAELGTQPVPPRLPPVGGAVLSAAKAAGWTVDETFIEKLARSLSSESAREPTNQQELPK